MRISTTWMQQTAINEILDRQSAMADTQAHVSSGKRILNASDDPVGAAQVLGLQHVAAANQQYQRNIDSASSRLGLETSSLDQVTSILQSVRSLALQGTNATETPSDRASIATQLRQLFSQLVQTANATDAQGDSLFAGNATRTTSFVQGSGFSVSYAGDDGQRMVAAAPGMQVATGDPGSNVFMDIPAGNGRFAVQADASNTGSLVVGSNSVTDIATYTPGAYTVTFAADGTWQAVDATDTPVGGGSYDSTNGGAISFNGMQIQLDGTPAAGDTLTVQSGATQDMFQSIGNLIDTFENTPPGTGSSNTVNRQIEGIDQSLQRVLDVQGSVGARINTLDQQKTSEGDLDVQYEGQISNLQDVDMASAIGQLNLQQVALQAAQQTYIKVQGMSLFDYLK
ncbi:MAG TPA: flagellar hook-associated protein FlgL [Rhodanobacteraceae bacterium]|nr:flagellar hook-associated protein FlgL [Rhodanobacteraceae bacterium]